MPLLVSKRWVSQRYTFGCLVLALSWGLGAAPVFALQAVLQARAPLCDQPRQNCQPLFFLQKGEPVQVLYRQGQDWFRVQHPLSQRVGWVSAAQLKLMLPTSLQQSEQRNVAGMLGFWSQGENTGVFSKRSLYALDALNTAKITYQKDFSFSGGERPMAVELPETGALAFHYLAAEEADKRWVLWQVNPFVTIPSFQNLAHFVRPEDFVGSTQKEGLTLIAGKSQGAWGEALLIALDSQGWPVWIYRDLRELWSQLPYELQTQLKAESFKLLALSPEGHLLMEAYNQKQAKKVILHWRYERTWVYQQMLQWPAALQSEAVKQWFLAASAEALVLGVNEAQKSHLFLFPAGLSELALHQVLAEPLHELKWDDTLLWTLDARRLTRWKPLYTQDTSVKK